MATPPSKRTAPLTVREVQWNREGTEGDSASSWSTSLQQGGGAGWVGACGGWVSNQINWLLAVVVPQSLPSMPTNALPFSALSTPPHQPAHL